MGVSVILLQVCPICRGEFGVLEERPPNILVKGLIQQFFSVEYERKRLKSAQNEDFEEVENVQPLSFRARAPVIRQSPPNRLSPSFLRKVVAYLRPVNNKHLCSFLIFFLDLANHSVFSTVFVSIVFVCFMVVIVWIFQEKEEVSKNKISN